MNQAKEKIDHLKQVEKKKRWLEKALDTTTTIHLELEKKKQRHKDEERPFDKEGVAFVEAMAL
jgi:hypothetical protein